jgi:hypothetical protein
MAFPVIFITLLFTFYLFLVYCSAWSKGLFLFASSCLILVSSSVCKSHLSILCSAALEVMNSFSFSLLWKVLNSHLIVKGSFIG